MVKIGRMTRWRETTIHELARHLSEQADRYSESEHEAFRNGFVMGLQLCAIGPEYAMALYREWHAAQDVLTSADCGLENVRALAAMFPVVSDSAASQA